MERLSSHRASFALFARHHHVLGDCAGHFLEFFWWICHYEILAFVFTSKKQEVLREILSLPNGQRSSIGLVDAILNDKIRNDTKKKTATVRELRSPANIGNGGKNFRRQPPGETDLRKWNGNFCFNGLEGKK